MYLLLLIKQPKEPARPERPGLILMEEIERLPSSLQLGALLVTVLSMDIARTQILLILLSNLEQGTSIQHLSNTNQ
jgi:hypothetical protein